MAKDFKGLVELARKKGARKIAVAVAEDKEVLLSIKRALDEKIVEPILVGNKDKIQSIGKEIDLDLSKVEIIHEEDGVAASRLATQLVSQGKADLLMKGLIDTSIIMKAVLDKEIGLRTERLISHVAAIQVPTYHKVLLITDAAMNIAPDLMQKKEIIENAVEIAHSLDIDQPKVAILAAKEKVSSKMEATVHGQDLKNMNKNGIIEGCIIDGPLALDNAVSKESALIKSIDGPVAGEADILMVPNIESGNILYKALTFLANGNTSGIITGTKAPIVLTSRADSQETKFNSIVLGVLKSSK